MNKFVCFMAVGLAFMALQVATVEADHVDTSHCDQFQGDPHAACMAAAETGMTGDHTGMTGDHTGMTGDHTGMTGDHTGMTGDHTGMAPGTQRMCGDVPCATDGGGDALGGQGGEDCAILPNADLVRECVARRTAGGN